MTMPWRGGARILSITNDKVQINILNLIQFFSRNQRETTEHKVISRRVGPLAFLASRCPEP